MNYVKPQTDYYDLCSAVGWYLGYGRGDRFGDQAWEAREKSIIEMCVKSGYAKFLYPVPVGGFEVYEWSFLRPHIEIVLRSGENSVDLPSSVSGIDGRVMLRSSGGSAHSIIVRPEPYVRHNIYMRPDASGIPECAALSFDDTENMPDQIKRLLFFPRANADYTVSFVAHLSPPPLSESNIFPLGGDAHSETIRQACLSAAETDVNNELGVHTQMFIDRVLASIRMDRLLKPKTFGYTGKIPTWQSPEWWNGWPRNLGRVTVNGVVPL